MTSRINRMSRISRMIRIAMISRISRIRGIRDKKYILDCLNIPNVKPCLILLV